MVGNWVGRGDGVVSWRTYLDNIASDDYESIYGEPPPQASDAAKMHVLRGLVMAQGMEHESVLREIVAALDPAANTSKSTAGRLLRDIQRLMAEVDREEWAWELEVMEKAIERRNHAVHNEVELGYSWVSYQTGGGEWMCVVSTMGGEVYDEAELADDLKLQHAATQYAVEIMVSLRRNRSDS